MTDNDALTNEIIAKPELVQSAMEIIMATDQLRSTLMRKLKTGIEREAPDHWKIVWSIDPWHRWSGFNIDFNAELPVVFRLEFGLTGYNDLCYGIYKREKSLLVSNDIREKALKCIGLGNGSNNELWPWWRQCASNDELLSLEKDWGKYAQPWAAIAEGALASLIVNAARQLEKAICT